MENPVNMAKRWLISRALKKVVVRLAGLIASFLGAKAAVLAGVGVDVNVDPEKLTLGIYGGFEMLRNLLKVKFPKQFGWL